MAGWAQAIQNMVQRMKSGDSSSSSGGTGFMGAVQRMVARQKAAGAAGPQTLGSNQPSSDGGTPSRTAVAGSLASVAKTEPPAMGTTVGGYSPIAQVETKRASAAPGDVATGMYPSAKLSQQLRVGAATLTGSNKRDDGSNIYS